MLQWAVPAISSRPARLIIASSVRQRPHRVLAPTPAADFSVPFAGLVVFFAVYLVR